MTDMLVSLKELPITPALAESYDMELARPWDSIKIIEWVKTNFSEGWASEVMCGLSQHPSRVLIIRQNTSIVGFACYNVTFPGFFGPTGVSDAHRNLGLGKVLLIESMHRLQKLGHVYGFIGSPGPVEFYQHVLDAYLLPEHIQDSYSEPFE